MITALGSRIMDINSEALGVSVDALMDSAGKAVADLVKERFPGKKVLVFCGRGNNGGDGLAAAYYLGKYAGAVMIDGREMRSEASGKMLSRLDCGISDFTGNEKDFDILVDAGLGTGTSGELRPAYSKYVDFCNDFEGYIVSVDVPTGFGCSRQVVPDITVTMVDVKEGMNTESCGKIVTADIGMPPEASSCVGPGDMLRYPVPEEDSRKGDNGKLLVIGGGPYFGAPAMCAKAAMRAGADYVRIATPDPSFGIVASWCPEFVMHRLDGKVLLSKHVPGLLKISKECDAVIIGPGLGKDPKTLEAVRKFIAGCRLPMAVDADALSAVKDIKLRKNIVLTPHLGEFKYLGGRERNPEQVLKIAKKFGCTVVLKGKTDLISDGGRVRSNTSGCAAMTSAGTGDVLAGVIGGLLAKGMSAFDAACVGAYLTGKAGELWFHVYSYGLMATDLVDGVAAALRFGLEKVGRRWTCSLSPMFPR